MRISKTNGVVLKFPRQLLSCFTTAGVVRKENWMKNWFTAKRKSGGLEHNLCRLTAIIFVKVHLAPPVCRIYTVYICCQSPLQLCWKCW